MSLSKQQKFDMIRDVELRLAKEELAEQYLKDVQAIENSDKPLRTLKELMKGNEHTAPETDISDSIATAEMPYEHQADDLPDFEIIRKQQQEAGYQTSEEKELLEQSEIAVKTPYKKPGMDSLSEWQFIGFETLVMQDADKRDINIQEHFENAQSMSNDNDMGMER